MKFTRILVASLTLLLATSAFAGTKASMTLSHPAVVNGTNLQAGDYKLEWEGTGPNVEVSIIKGKNVIAKVPARLVDMGHVAQNNAVVFTTSTDGSNTISGARFQGKTYGLEIGEASDYTQSGSSK